MDRVKVEREELKAFNNIEGKHMEKMKHQSLEPNDGNDWWEEMPDNVREDVEESILQIERGEGMPHEEVKEMQRNWFVK